MDAKTSRFADRHALKDKHKGETCILVGNGKSLADVDIEFLNAYPTFASNYIHMYNDLDRGEFWPTYFTIGSYNVIYDEESQEWVRPTIQMADAAFITKFGSDLYQYENVWPLNRAAYYVFSYDPIAWVFLGANSTVTNLQYAYYMGFTRAFLVGVDHDYSGEQTHMHPDYITARGITPMLNRGDGRQIVDMCYRMCDRAWSAAGREIINLNPDSLLDVFPKMELQVEFN